MTISASILLWVFAGLFGLLLLVALVHIIQGLRFGAGSKLIVTSTILFLLGILVVCSATYVVLRPVDWHSSLSLALPSTSNNDQTQ